MSGSATGQRLPRLRTPDWVLLRRFGLVRAVGAVAYSVAVAVLFGIFGLQVWPLALGVPVLAMVTTAYLSRSARYPRTAIAASLVADALVLGAGVAFLGGTGSGLVMLYTIVVVSAGILLGPLAAAGFTALTVLLSLLQLGLEQLGVEPVLLHRPALGERLPILLISLGGLLSVGYLSAVYASRLHELIVEAGQEAEALRVRGRRRRQFVRRARADVREALVQVEGVAEALDRRWPDLSDQQRRELASRLRMQVTQLDADVSLLADVGAMDESDDRRPEPVALRRVVEDCLVALGDRMEPFAVELEVPALKVLADRRAARRVALNLLDNVAEHCPAGTHVRVTGVSTAGRGVLVVTDDGPGVPESVASRLFDPPDGKGAGGRASQRVGLPLVRELCEAMGARVRYEPVAGGGSRFLVSFRLAPSAAPSADDEATAAPA